MHEPPRPGMVVQVGAAASVQFAGRRALLFRVTRVSERPTYHGWCWLTGYTLDEYGEAVVRREIYVQFAGLRPIRRHPQKPKPGLAPPPRHRPSETGRPPARVPTGTPVGSR
ncbi:hypothetical protein [Plantactinospora endophytica]|uniref:Uncharacterized protein n=1 Tax=Plantactinospora endophytica TaxID=673535 RepID=A0ABQ4DU44_9ACTN|nr:hypothetical protein [Plantactinospora endophytica]GIG85973.1 hypothetical protein Pen02_09090 [Plantactinospora endophytica]